MDRRPRKNINGQKKKMEATPAELAIKWNKFQERKRGATALILAKSEMEVNQNDRDVALKLWKHINTRRKKTERFQCSLTTKEGRMVEGDEAKEFIKQTIEATFSELETNDIGQNTGNSTSQDETTETTMKEWESRNSKVPVRTATGPDGIGVRLVKALGKKKAHKN